MTKNLSPHRMSMFLDHTLYIYIFIMKIVHKAQQTKEYK